MTDLNSSEVMVDRDHGVVLLDDTGLGLDPRAIGDALAEARPEMAALVRWTMSTQGGGRRAGSSIFERDRYVVPGSIYEQMRVAHDATQSDDIVSGVIELTESLAFSRVSFACENEDEEDIWNQIAEAIDLDSRLREMWREIFTVSQFYAVNWWGNREFKVRGTSAKGVKRKKSYSDVTVPIGVTLLDPLKVIPVGNLMFNQDRLAYIADFTEVDMLDAAAMGDPNADQVAKQIIVSKYTPTDIERKNLIGWEVPAERLYTLNPQFVWRHTETRAQYERFASVRMKAVFPLLDLKHQLREMDRAHLIGGTNFIVLVKKGSEKEPAKQPELENLQSQVRTVARVPVIISDHRLEIEIVTPKTDMTLNADKYSTLDNRIQSRLFQMLMVHGGSGAVRSDDTVKMAKLVAKGLESRRHQLRRAIERYVIGPTLRMNPQLDCKPQINFHPTRIDLEFDAATVQFLLDLRDRGDLSRETILNELDFDQAQEAMKREREAEKYDDIFTQTNVPFTAPGPGHQVGVGPGGKPKEDTDPGDTATPPGQVPAPKGTPPHSHAPTGEPVALNSPNQPAAGKPKADPRTAGRNKGGRRNGGGAAPGTGQGQEPRGRPKNT